MTLDALSRFRAQIPDCDLALYVDFAAGTVLAKASTLNYPQEYLDALCGTAALLFAEVDSLPGAECDHVLVLTNTGARGFLRNTASDGEALCCICGPDTDLSRVVSTGRATLRNLGSAG